MRIRRVFRNAGRSAYLDLHGCGTDIRARVRVVRDSDNAALFTPPFVPRSRDSVVQWAFEFLISNEPQLPRSPVVGQASSGPGLQVFGIQHHDLPCSAVGFQ